MKRRFAVLGVLAGGIAVSMMLSASISASSGSKKEVTFNVDSPSKSDKPDAAATTSRR